MKRKTSKFILAATTAKPNSIKTKLKATYPGLSFSALSFCKKIIIIMEINLKTEICNLERVYKSSDTHLKNSIITCKAT